MPKARSRRKKKRRSPIRSLRLPALPRVRLVDLEQSQLDAIGLGLVAVGVFLSLVLYFGWEGGKVGEGLADLLRFLLGKVAYLTPLLLLGSAAALVLRP